MADHRDDKVEATSSDVRSDAWFADFMGRHRVAINLVVHNILFALGLLAAYLVWFEAAGRFSDIDSWWTRYFQQLPFFLISKSIVFGRMKLFRGSWQYAGIRDVVTILMASVVSLGVAYVAVTALGYAPGWFGKKAIYKDVSNGVLMLDFLSTVFFVCTARLTVRLYHEEMRPISAEGVKRVLVVGAGHAAEVLLREIHRMPVERYRVIGLVDDNPGKKGVFIHGIPVLGDTDQLKEICDDEEVDEILIAMPSATQKELRRIISMCQGAQLQFQTLPSMGDLIGGRVTVNQIRKVKIEDLLGRAAVDLDSEAVGRFLHGRRVLITGAGGSIGSEMCRQVCAFAPARLALLEQAENSLFEIAGELGRKFPEIVLAQIVSDIYDRDRVMAVMAAERPEVVIHAAAHKHVPLMELNACEAVKNNIFGSKNVADASCEFDVEDFVLISTDKAVNPSSIMGCTKRVAEIYTQSLNGRDGCRTQFRSVRFGNVLGSAGSVVPTFERQIREGGPITITDPEMTRYFMTIPEAAQLVLQASTTGQGGQIFLLDMGEPVKIVDLAGDMITLSGLRVGDDIDIVFTGARPGEKLFEKLRTEGEDILPTTHEKVHILRTERIDWDRVQAGLSELAGMTNSSDREAIIRSLRALVPEYVPANHSPEPSTSKAAGQ